MDADEFIVLQGGPAGTPPPPSLPALLQRYEQHGGLALHWRQFASGGQVLRPEGGVLSTYTACTEELKATVIKSVVQPRLVNRTRTVHSFVYVEGKYAVNTAGARIEGGNRRNPVPVRAERGREGSRGLRFVGCCGAGSGLGMCLACRLVLGPAFFRERC